MDDSWRMFTRRVAKPVYVPEKSGTLVVRKRPNPKKQLVRTINRVFNAKEEIKHIDWNSIYGAQTGNAGAGIFITDITNIGPGTAVNQRIGDQLNPKRFEFQLLMDCQATNPSNQFRLIIFQYRLDNTAGAPTLANILDPGPTGLVAGNITVMSPYNFDLRHQYTILYDGKWQAQGSLGSSKNTQVVKKVVRLSKRCAKVNYNAGVNTGDHHIFTVLFAEQPAGATAGLTTFNGRLIYRDT